MESPQSQLPTRFALKRTGSMTSAAPSARALAVPDRLPPDNFAANLTHYRKPDEIRPPSHTSTGTEECCEKGEHVRRRPPVCFVTRSRRRARRDMRGSARPHSVGHHAYVQVPRE